MQVHDSDRANTAGWTGLAIACVIAIVTATGTFVTYGIPGSTGGTSQNQQQTSGVPKPENDVQDGATRQNTTGYGSKEQQPQPTNKD